MEYHSRNRQRTGAAVLTEDQVAHIKHRLFTGTPPRSIADEYGVGIETVRRISRGDTWGWVPAKNPKDEPKPDFDQDASLAALQRMLGDAKEVSDE